MTISPYRTSYSRAVAALWLTSGLLCLATPTHASKFNPTQDLLRGPHTQSWQHFPCASRCADAPFGEYRISVRDPARTGVWMIQLRRDKNQGLIRKCSDIATANDCLTELAGDSLTVPGSNAPRDTTAAMLELRLGFTSYSTHQAHVYTVMIKNSKANTGASCTIGGSPAATHGELEWLEAVGHVADAEMSVECNNKTNLRISLLADAQTKLSNGTGTISTSFAHDGEKLPVRVAVGKGMTRLDLQNTITSLTPGASGKFKGSAVISVDIE